MHNTKKDNKIRIYVTKIAVCKVNFKPIHVIYNKDYKTVG